MSNYLIELSVIHTVLILGYWFFLRKERQYAKLRFYLIGATLLALTIPLLKLPKLFFNSKVTTDVIPMEAITMDVMTTTPTTDVSFWNYDLFIWMYIAISAFFLFKFLGSVLYLLNLERKSNPVKCNDLHILKAPNIEGSFTFFNWIFLSDEINENQQDYDVILKHEKAHASLGHTYDLIFFELFKVYLWWLPSTWFINKEIKKIHEYQADAYALKSYNVSQYSSILISSTLKSNGLSLASSFHDGLILKRIKAMKQNAKNVSPWKLGALGSLCAILFVVFACSEESKDASDMDGQLLTIVEEMPEYPGGMDAFYSYLQNEISYPSQAKQMGVEGRVFVNFIIEKDGSLSNVKTIKGIGAGCDDEAVRALQNTPSFKPGSQRGRAVKVRMIVPITFKLSEDKKGMIIVAEPKIQKFKLKVDAKYANGEWSGTVNDEEDLGLPGVNIIVAGTSVGTASDIEGNFKVKADESKELNISFVGYETVRLGQKLDVSE